MEAARFRWQPRGQELGDQGLGWSADGFLAGDPAVLEPEDPVGEGEDPVVVGHDHEGHAALVGQPLDQPHDRLPVLGVERGGRLVGEEDGRLIGQGPGDRHPLAFARAQLGGPQPRGATDPPGPGARRARLVR